MAIQMQTSDYFYQNNHSPIAGSGFACVGLVNPKTPANVGSVLRAAQVYGAAMVALTGRRFKQWPTDTMNGWREYPFLHVADLHSVIPYDCVPVAVDLIGGAKSLIEYKHPERAFYIFGPEDGTLGKSVTAWCRDVIYVPTKHCMNLAACVNVVLYDRLAKSAAKPIAPATRSRRQPK